MTRTRMSLACTMVALLAISVGTAWAQNTSAPTGSFPVFEVNYFSNANTSGAPDGTVRITNPGSYSGGDLCADIFVFDANQEMSECCSCKVTPDGLKTLSVNKDLTNNPLTGVVLKTGAIKILSAVPTPSDTCPVPNTKITPAPELRAWGTHIQDSNFTITEEEFRDSDLIFAERQRLQAQCNAIVIDGSGAGICTCGVGS